MDISRLFVFLSASVVAFCAATYVVLSTPSLQWVGVDSFVWPTGFAFLAISILALLIPAFPRGKRVIARSPHKISFAISYSVLAVYTIICLFSLILYPFRLASGI